MLSYITALFERLIAVAKTAFAQPTRIASQSMYGMIGSIFTAHEFGKPSKVNATTF